MSAASPIVTSDLVVDYPGENGPIRALACTALSVPGGTSVAIMGPSGSGKSTLLGLLAGLALPTEGTVTIGEEMISALTERERVRFRRRALGMVYQADNLLPHLTVEENVALQLAISRDTSSDQRGDPAALLDRLGLALLARRLPHQLSGGERQRVAVARAVIHGPQVILADEPTGALDAASGQIVIELLVDVHKEVEATLVVVTHDPRIAARLTRIIHLEAQPSPAVATHAR
ncbi:MAG: ATP-binding cassette domain-containing protein [Chloroflexota bacterium]|nr:ATP-binding cassette domain-containing protein [Chloroflexota bacterium]